MNLYARSEYVIEELINCMDLIPEPNCSCHIEPPCSDCVDHGWERELQKTAKELIQELKAAQLLLPK
jgi:hypothetical protein